MTTSHARFGRASIVRTIATLAAGAALLLAGASAASAAELTVAWRPTNDDVTGGYDVEVLDDGGRVIQTIDARSATTAVVSGLADGTTYRFRVRPYDQWGNRAEQPSADIATMPAPRVDMLSRWEPAGATATAELLGANFAPGARLIAKRAGLVVTSTTVIDPGKLTAEVSNPGGVSPVASDFLVVNPVRRADAFLAAHPELLDVNQDGAVDEADADAVAAAFGAPATSSRGRSQSRSAPGTGTMDAASSTGTTGVVATRPELDVNGDGMVDGEDLAAIRARLVTPAGNRPDRNPKTR